MVDPVTAWDMSGLMWMYAHRNDLLDGFFSFITHFGDKGLFFIALGLILIIFSKTRKCGLTVAVALAIGVIVGNVILKNVVARIRPFDLYDVMNGTKDYIDTIVKRPDDWSFPSGHTMAAFATATAVFGYYKKAGLALIIFAVIMGFSRFYLFVHYPTDIICGGILGIISAFIAIKLVNAFFARRERRF